MNRETILRKIRACLRLAASPNANEAAAALRQARALMAQYAVSADEADPDGICGQTAKTRQRGGDIHFRTWMLAVTCANLFGCYVYGVQRRRESTTVRFVGVRPNPELAEYAFAVLYRQLEQAVSKHLVRVRKASNRRIRADAFGESWVHGLRAALGDQLAALPMDDHARFHAWSQVEAGCAIETTEAEQSRPTARDYTAGYLAGRNAKLNRGVGGRAQRLLEVGHG